MYTLTKEGKRKLDVALRDSPVLSRLGAPPLEHLGPQGLALLDEQKLQVAVWRQLAAMFYMQLDTRILPKLMADHYGIGCSAGPSTAGAKLDGVDRPRKLTDFGLISHGLLLNQWLLGHVSHEIKYVPFVMTLLQRECGFRPGECVCFELYAWPTLGHCWRGLQQHNDVANPRLSESVSPCWDSASFVDRRISKGCLRLGGSALWLVRDACEGVVKRGKQSATTIGSNIAQPSDWGKQLE